MERSTSYDLQYCTYLIYSQAREVDKETKNNKVYAGRQQFPVKSEGGWNILRNSTNLETRIKNRRSIENGILPRLRAGIQVRS